MILFAIVAVPIVAALSCAVPRSERSAPYTIAAASSVSLGLSIWVAAQTLAHGGVVAVDDWVSVNAFSAVLLLGITAVACSASWYSIAYIAHLDATPQRVRLYYANFALFIASMLAIAVCVEPGLAWIAVELTTLLSVLLVSFNDTREALEAAWKYMVITLLGATVAVLGILVLFWAHHAAGGGPFTYAALAAEARHMNPTLVAAAFALLLIGFGAKIGFFPMHTWLPDAHSQAPAPVCAMLSGVETTAVFYVLLRLLALFRAVPGLHADAWFAVFGTASLVAAALLIVQTRDLKRLFAFSTVENMGTIALGAAVGTLGGDVGAIWQILAHALTKSVCFYAAGAVTLVAGTTEFARLGGLQRRAPVVGTVLLLASLAIAGAPPFALFLSELAIIVSAVTAGKVWIACVLVVFIGIAFAGTVAKVSGMLLGTEHGGAIAHPMPRLCRA
ncbi:MAG: proton-conducting transporter membrane subunit, partial [Vulcanimicrobiaceae bacterium]